MFFHKSKQKYNAKSVVIDGVKFSSQLEARFYLYLKDHDYTIMELQPRFLLQDAFEHDGKKYRKTEYVADFRIETQEGDRYIVEVKGFETEAWKLKKKLFLGKYGNDENPLLVVKSIRDFERKIGIVPSSI